MTNPRSSATFQPPHPPRAEPPPAMRFSLPIDPHPSARSAPPPLVLALLALCVSSCASSSGFFRMRNPFPEESKVVSTWLDPEARAEAKLAKEDARRDRSLQSEQAEAPAPSPYFGRGNAKPPAPTSSPYSSSSSHPSPEPPLATSPTTPSPTSSSSYSSSSSPPQKPPLTASPATLSSPPLSGASAPPPKQPAGDPCYRCNGKGYHLSSLAPGADFIICEVCGGTGRKPR